MAGLNPAQQQQLHAALLQHQSTGDAGKALAQDGMDCGLGPGLAELAQQAAAKQ